MPVYNICFLKFNLHMYHLDWVLKFGFWLSGSDWGPNYVFLISFKVDADAPGSTLAESWHRMLLSLKLRILRAFDLIPPLSSFMYNSVINVNPSHL